MRHRLAFCSSVTLVVFVCFACSQEPAQPKASGEAAGEQAAIETGVFDRGKPARLEADREPCANRNPLRNAYFGDFHVHTNVSMDAYIFGTLTDAGDAYRFAQGEAISTARESASDTQQIQLERPLDFAAVTDHASYLGEVKLCTTPESGAYDLVVCKMYRGEVPVPLPEGLNLGGNAVTAEIGARMAALGDPAAGPSAVGTFPRSPQICGGGNQRCTEWNRSVWRDLQSAAEEAYDRSSACKFTTFKAYEYTATPDLAKVHRNIIFRGEVVPEIPISFADEPDAYAMWEALRVQCLDAGTGCDVVSIPHNSNLSNGRMFQVDYTALPLEEQLRRVRLRERIEPLVEIMQIKGDSECRNRLAGVLGGRDELCDFERFRSPTVAWEDCGDGGGAGALVREGCISKRDYVRYALAEGLREEARLGVNPFKLGFIASTDAHNSNLGDTEERSYDGWSGVQDSTPERRLRGDIAALSPIAANPGGLVGVWAEENSRDAIFDSLQRRETFGTSGTRIQPRFFGGWSYDPAICDAADTVARAYAGGISMGGDLPVAPAPDAAPSFVVSALRDPGTVEVPGGKLQRIQIIKGWAGDAGALHQRIYDVAGEADNGASVDPSSCTPTGPGHDSLCAVWSDPDFDPAQGAVYYARVVENPSCRWNAWQCLAFPEDARPASCSDPLIPQVIQERAWTSPIWYSPQDQG